VHGICRCRTCQPQINHRIVIGFFAPAADKTSHGSAFVLETPPVSDLNTNLFDARLLGAATVVLVALPWPAAAQGLTTPWVDGYNSKTRLIAAALQPKPTIHAGIEITMAAGWKTYWRNPGDAGGVPPHIDWAESTNIAAVKVLFPAPSRLKDASGDSIGYKSAVIFPLEITPKDAAKPVDLKLAIEFGVCREICVPAEAKIELSVPASGPVGADKAAADKLAGSLASVPRQVSQRRPNDPQLKSVTATLTGDKPNLVIDAAFPGGANGCDLFLEASDGVYVPMPAVPAVLTGDSARFTVDLATSGVDPNELKGRTLTLTLVSPHGASEMTHKLAP
jgi:DsbC/DsbD-like thiol-disulfide interchange protein